MRKLAEHDARTVFLSASDAHELKSPLTAYQFFCLWHPLHRLEPLAISYDSTDSHACQEGQPDLL